MEGYVSPLLDMGQYFLVGYFLHVQRPDVFLEHRLGDLPGHSILRAEGPVVKINSLRHVILAIVPPEPPHLGNGTAPPQFPPRDLYDGFDDLQCHELLENPVGGGLGHTELDLEQPCGGGPHPAEVNEDLARPLRSENTPTNRQYLTIAYADT